MSIRKSQWTNINGNRVELSSHTYKREDRHFHREARTHDNNLKQNNDYGNRKNIKVPIARKLT
jgi:hypothetical protein